MKWVKNAYIAKFLDKILVHGAKEKKKRIFRVTY